MPDLRPDIAAAAFAVRAAAESDSEPGWSVGALRPAVLTDMARYSNTLDTVPARWQATQWARDLMRLISGTDGIGTRALAKRCGMSLTTTARLLEWLRAQDMVDTVAGAHFPGPLMALATQPGQKDGLLKQALASLRDELQAAVYISSYTDGEIQVQEAAFSSTAPPVDEWAPFKDTGHASAVGKSLLAQLDFRSRMDHLTRYPSIALTERTITSPRALIEILDGHGPHAAQFDLLEYSSKEVCVAYSLGLPGRASSIALSLPSHQYSRLISAARRLSQRSTGLLLAHLLTTDSIPTQADTWENSTPEPRHALP